VKISYDPEVDALSIIFWDTTVTTKHLAEGIAADYDSEDCLAGLEIRERTAAHQAVSELATARALPPSVISVGRQH
jgi:uncharacterized protein YuzE